MRITTPSASEGPAASPVRSRGSYLVLVAVEPGPNLEPHIRAVVTRARGELHSLNADAGGDPTRRWLHLGRRRVDDVVAALNAGNFAVDAIVALPG